MAPAIQILVWDFVGFKSVVEYMGPVVKYVGPYRWSSKSVSNYTGPFISGKLSRTEAPQHYVPI